MVESWNLSWPPRHRSNNNVGGAYCRGVVNYAIGCSGISWLVQALCPLLLFIHLTLKGGFFQKVRPI